MLAWRYDEALRRTRTTGRMTSWRRSRGEYGRKANTSGHAQYGRSVALDCDGAALLVRADQVGAACHTGTRTCFEAGGLLDAVVGHRPETDGQDDDGTPLDPAEPALGAGAGAVTVGGATR